MATDGSKEPAPSKQDLGLLEEDDEFEEFPVEGSRAALAFDGFSRTNWVWFSPDWGAADEEASDKHVWEDDWDDSNVEDSFSKQLR